MRKKIMKAAFVAVFAAVAGYGVYMNQRTEAMSDLMLANVEALAGGESDYNSKVWERYYRPEGDGYNCTKTGNETC